MSERSQSPSTPPSTPPSLEEFESDWSDSDHVPTEPAYSIEEMVEIFLNFYNFLKTIHFRDVNLKMPPPGGWPNIPESTASPKSDRVYEVIRHLPYFDDAPQALLHYKSRLLDYTRMSLHDVEEEFDVMGDLLEGSHWSARRDMEIDISNTFPFSHGWETGGKAMYFNVWDGEVSEENLRLDGGDPVDLRTYFDQFRGHFESLRLIPCYNRTIIDDIVPEHTGVITEEQFLSQKEEEWGTDLDVQYIRQLYRGFGWPHAFRQDEAIQVVNQLMDKIKDRRQEWDVGNTEYANRLYY
ncbi:hypothetical protein LCI18_002297 [Fusarium solani-melongenae]|uniref:Uncharacterized protein n=1 Tax=Fusarium solani subsp. cucurbitae TaxID=2747967 RepID=A0ACD3YQV2_FUSSC|nr:hypothetical protein LCI18_002297 [Fusarium solani-melongenae]